MTRENWPSFKQFLRCISQQAQLKVIIIKIIIVTCLSTLVRETSEQFAELSTSTEKVIHLVAEISGASEEQAQGALEINQAITDVDKVVQQNAANAQKGAGASQLLKAQANQLSRLVSGLVSMVKGVRHREAPKEVNQGVDYTKSAE